MTDDQIGSSRVLQRIAEALGADIAIFSNKREDAGSVKDTLELLTVFEQVADREDRRACIDFIRSVVAGQSTPSDAAQ